MTINGKFPLSEIKEIHKRLLATSHEARENAKTAHNLAQAAEYQAMATNAAVLRFEQEYSHIDFGNDSMYVTGVSAPKKSHLTLLR